MGKTGNRIRHSIIRLLAHDRALPDDGTVAGIPCNQATADLFDHWISTFPVETGIKTNGYAALFEDARATWAIERLGGASGLDILELGPLEGAHSYMLHRAGASSILGIEAMKRSYLKCLVTKELLRIDRAHFLLGDFVPWLESNARTFDLIWASGVLYHMAEPLRLLELIAKRTDRLYLWTHFCPDDFPANPPFAKPVVRTRNVEFAGRAVTHFELSYMGSQATKAHCGGILPWTSRLRRRDILFVLGALGYTDIETEFEDHASPNGPSFAIVARR